MAIRTRINIPLTEEFMISDYSRYSTIQGITDNIGMGRTGSSLQPWGLTTQKHIDIRTFNPSTAPLTETWVSSPTTAFTTGPHPFLNNWNSFVSSVIGVVSFTSQSLSIDLTKLGPNANVILALPNFPLAEMNLAQCFLDFSPDNFATVASVSFAASTTTLANGDTTATWPVSAFTGATLTSMTSVRFRFNTYGAANIMMAGLRLVGPSWIPGGVDFDSWNGALQQAIPVDGARGGFPVAGNAHLPLLWYAAPTSGIDDPQPINSKIGVVFNTGSMNFSNDFTIALRGVGGQDISQLILDNETQIQINGPQPLLSTAAVLPRTVADFDNTTVGSLDTQSMYSLDAVQATISQSWAAFTVTWGVGPGVSIARSATPTTGYNWTGANATAIANLSPRTYYLCLLNLEDTTAQLQIFNVNQTTFAIGTLVFDTGLIQDSYQFPRRPGRIGWQAHLLDGDAQIRSIRPHSLSYGEYRSMPLNSNTPLKGARLYAHFSPFTQLWQSFTTQNGAGGIAPQLTADAGRSITGSSTRVFVSTPSAAGQGAISNVLTPVGDAVSGIVDFAQTEIHFSTWFPSGALLSGSGFNAFLLSQDGNKIPLSVPGITPDQWQAIVAYPPTTLLPSGRYRLMIVYTGTVAATFWIDNVSVIERTVVWSARVNPTDPWLEFKDITNTDTGGVSFVNRGTALQVRAQARRQDDVVLGAPKVVPVYAELGQAVWPENVVPDPLVVPVNTLAASYTSVRNSLYTYTFNGTASTPAGGLINYLWTFGDGATANGPIVQHIFPLTAPSGTNYSVGLTVVDTYATRNTLTNVVAVT